MDKKIIAAITFVVIAAFCLTIVGTVAQTTTSKPVATKYIILWKVDSQALPANIN